jgi:hypothetical protein
MLEETVGIFCFEPLEGEFESFNEFIANAINRKLQNLRNVCSFTTAKLVCSSGAMSHVIMELQTVQTPWAVDRESGHMFEVATARTAEMNPE